MLASTLAFSQVRRAFRQPGDPGYRQSWLGALLFAAGTAVPFAFDAATFAVSAVLLLRLPVTRQPLRLPTHRTTMRDEGREGIAWLWRHTGVRAFAIGAAVANMAHTAAMAIVVLLVRDRLHASDLAFGLALTGVVIGSIMAAQLASWIVERTGRRRAVRASIGTFSLSLLCIALAPSVEVVAIGLGTFGAAGEVWNVVAVSYRQALVPDHLLGRVMVTYRVIAYGAMPVGAALGGLGGKVAGVGATFLAGAAATVLLLVNFLSPHRADIFGP
jgi:Transmembrane secretion effector